MWGVLLCVPGIVDEAPGKVLFSPNVHWSEGVDFRTMLRGMTNVPVEMVQEIRSLALGQLASSPKQKDFLLVDFGNGVGGAAVIWGDFVYRGVPLVCELGHTPVLDNQRVCGCGSVGCMETLLSRRGLFASVQEHAGQADGGGEIFVGARGSVYPAEGAGAVAAAEPAGGCGQHQRGDECAGRGPRGDHGDDVQAAGIGAGVPGGGDKAGAMWGKFGEVTIEFEERRRMRG